MTMMMRQANRIAIAIVAVVFWACTSSYSTNTNNNIPATPTVVPYTTPRPVSTTINADTIVIARTGEDGRNTSIYLTRFVDKEYNSVCYFGGYGNFSIMGCK